MPLSGCFIISIHASNLWQSDLAYKKSGRLLSNQNDVLLMKKNIANNQFTSIVQVKLLEKKSLHSLFLMRKQTWFGRFSFSILFANCSVPSWRGQLWKLHFWPHNILISVISANKQLHWGQESISKQNVKGWLNANS